MNKAQKRGHAFQNSLNPVMNSFGVSEPLPSASNVTKTFSSSSRLRGNSGCSLCNDKTCSNFIHYYRIRRRLGSIKHPYYSRIGPLLPRVKTQLQSKTRPSEGHLL